MTLEEDKIFLNILSAVNELDLDDELLTEEIMYKFALMYKEKTDNREFKSNPYVLEIIKNVIPEYFL